MCHMGPKVFINCAGFIKIDTASLGDRLVSGRAQRVAVYGAWGQLERTVRYRGCTPQDRWCHGLSAPEE